MVQIAGVYQHQKNENLKEFVMAIGENAEFATKADAATSSMEFVVSGDNYTVKNVYPDKTVTFSFTLGAEFDDPMPTGISFKSVATLNGNTIAVKTFLNGAQIGYRNYDFSDSGCVITMGATATTHVAKRIYSRQ
ncbi:PREDICTED: fatty acid-binding protein-like [Nicrophorus vespilloides]|uniref:Fatty acid-binding protein-like n=1 Tax=Nicrophorus vespilloides TaxID=110193 RepID=A0ABM1MYT0_NICVS|nr:PREDICTED: fatty acid-binding protein-like [Nicrophorus vespilloides]